MKVAVLLLLGTAGIQDFSHAFFPIECFQESEELAAEDSLKGLLQFCKLDLDVSNLCTKDFDAQISSYERACLEAGGQLHVEDTVELICKSDRNSEGRLLYKNIPSCIGKSCSSADLVSIEAVNFETNTECTNKNCTVDMTHTGPFKYASGTCTYTPASFRASSAKHQLMGRAAAVVPAITSLIVILYLGVS